MTKTFTTAQLKTYCKGFFVVSFSIIRNQFLGDIDKTIVFVIYCCQRLFSSDLQGVIKRTYFAGLICFCALK